MQASRRSGLLVLALLAFLVGLLPRTSLHPAIAFESARFVPVAAGAYRFGTAGGVLTALAAALPGLRQPLAAWFSDTALLCLSAVFIAILFDRLRRREPPLREAEIDRSTERSGMREDFEGMKRAERLFALGQLSAGLAHEIRNPLASISGAVGVVRRYPDDLSKRDECFDIIEKECRRLNRLLTNFIDFARPRQPHFQPVELGEVIGSVTALAQHAVGRQPISVRSGLDPSPLEIVSDGEQLQQVLLNLTINAIQASAEGGEVILEARLLDPSTVVIAVRDQGSGVNQEHIDRLFDPFFTTKETGSGLGLPVAHEIVRQMGGVLAASRNSERGMTFSITLPREPKGIHEQKANPAS